MLSIENQYGQPRGRKFVPDSAQSLSITATRQTDREPLEARIVSDQQHLADLIGQAPRGGQSAPPVIMVTLVARGPRENHTMALWQRLLITLGAMLVVSYLAGLLASSVLGMSLPSYLAGVIGGLTAIPVWEFLKRVGPKTSG